MNRSAPYFVLSMVLGAFLILPGCSPQEKDMQVQSRILGHFSSYYPNVPFLVEMSGGECAFDSRGYMAARPVVWKQGIDAKMRSADEVVNAIGENSFLIAEKTQDNIVVIRWKDVSKNILDVQINHIDFSKMDRYSAHRSLEALLVQQDVQKKAKMTNMKMGLRFASLAGDLATDGPYLDDNFDNIKVEQALLKILKTFKGGIIYTECVKPNGETLFNVGYYPPGELTS